MSFIDKTVEGVPTVTETNDSLVLSSWTDRVYLNTPDTLTLDNVTESGAGLVFNKTNLPDAVVWTRGRRRRLGWVTWGLRTGLGSYVSRLVSVSLRSHCLLENSGLPAIDYS